MSETESTSGQRSYPPVLVAVAVALLLLLAIASFGSYRDLEAARQRQDLLEAKIKATELRNEALSQRIHRLQNDPAAIERLAREQYRMMRPGDVMVILPEDPVIATSSAPPSSDSL